MLEAFFTLLSSILFQTSCVEGKSSFPKPLTHEREHELLEAFRAGDIESRDELIKHNMRLVVHVVKKYSNYPDVDELVSVGSIGLIKAVNTFASGKGTQLATYAARCIENEILMTLRANKKLKNNRSLFEPISYDKDGNEITLIDLIATDEDSVVNAVDGGILSEKLGKILRELLDKRELDILIMRYGLFETPQYTQIEVANKLGISRSYISRIEKRSLAKLRLYLIKNNITISY